MNKFSANSGSRAIVEVTEEERSSAKTSKGMFSDSIKKMESALGIILSLRDVILEQRPSKDDLKTKYRGRLIRYRKKIRDAFNDFLSHTKLALEGLEEISDPEMNRLRDILIAEIEEFSDGAEAVLDLLKNSHKDNFTKKLEEICAQMEKRKKSIEDVVDDQLYGHINQDILGKTKISKIRFRIQKRSRIVKQIARGL